MEGLYAYQFRDMRDFFQRIVPKHFLKEKVSNSEHTVEEKNRFAEI